MQLNSVVVRFGKRRRRSRPTTQELGQHALLLVGSNVAQLDVSGQDIASVYRQGLVRSGAKMPVFEMLAGGAIPTGRYWQATLLVQFLLADAGRTHALAAALHDMRAMGSADLRPHLERHFGMDVPRFSAAFWSWAWAEYARGPGA